MEPLMDILKKKASKPVYNAMQFQKFVKSLQLNWEVIFGELAAHLSFSFFKQGTLYLDSDNPLWVSEIDYYQDDLIPKINAHLPKKIVTKLSVKYKKKEMVTAVSQTKALSFKEKIVGSNRQKRESGQRPCSQCGAVFTAHQVCVFCEAENRLNSTP